MLTKFDVFIAAYWAMLSYDAIKLVAKILFHATIGAS